MSIQKEIEPLLHESDVAFAGVFGSYARGEATKKSDLDILVRFKKQKSLLEIVNLETRLSDTLNQKVDLVTEPALCVHIRKDVLLDLQPIYGIR